MPFAATWMDPEIIVLSEVSQTEKDKCHMIIYCLYVESKKKKMVLIWQDRNKDTDIENGLEDMGRERGSWGEVRVALTCIHYQM